MHILDTNIWWEVMNRIVRYALLVSSMMMRSDAMDQPGESLVLKLKPQKLNKRKVQEDLVRSCRELLKETAGLITDASLLNECAGDCAADVLEGALAQEDKKRLDDLASRMKTLVTHVRHERSHLTKEKKVLDELRKQPKNDLL